MINRRLKTGIKGFMAVLVTSLLLVFLFPDNLGSTYTKAYIVNAISLIICEIILSNFYVKNRFDFFSPMTIISFLYILMYFVTPIYDILSGNTLWFGYDLFKYSFKSTLVALAGYIAFVCLYSWSYKKNKHYKFRTILKNNADIKYSVKLISFIMLMYVVCFVANAYYAVTTSGNSLLYILTLGIFDSGGTETVVNAPIGFISMFSFCLPTITLLYWEYGKSNFLKFAMFVPMLMMQVARGFRFFVIQIAITFLAYYYLKKGTRPKLYKIMMFGLVVMIPVLIMTMFRNGIRAGEGMNLGIISGESIVNAFDDAIWDNLRIYKNFYGIAGRMPSRFSYVGLRQILIGTIVMIIPRIVWPGKISSGTGITLGDIIGNVLDEAGQAYPNIGEYYMAFGTIGVIFFMALYGWWMKKIKVKYMDNARNGIDIITFSVLLGVNLQLLIRGYTPSNFWYIVFSLLPILAIKIFNRFKFR